MKRILKTIAKTLSACALLIGISQAQSYRYTLRWENPQSHLYFVSLETEPAEGEYTDFQLPAWRPGRYYIQDYAAGITEFEASDSEGIGVEWMKIDNHTWRVKNPSSGVVSVSYQFYANTMDAGSSVLDASEAYFNPVNLFMHIRDVYDRPCSLDVASMPANWKSATALKKVPGKHNVFTTPDYHDFVDSPTILSPDIKTLHTRIGEADFYFHFQGEFPDDKDTEDAYQENMSKMIREQTAIFGEMPLKEYHFIYHLLPYNMGHAVEHKYSSSFAMPATVATSPKAIGRLNSISSHEFFHLWNVKRIRPAAMWPYDYQKEAYTTQHWFTEGVTDYYTSLTLQRCGLYSKETFFRIMANTIRALENNYASKAISPSQSSFDSWLERSEYHLPYHRISYYTLGTRVGLLMDLELRKRSGGKLSTDDLFKKLYIEFYKKDKGVGEDDIQKSLEALSGSDWDDFFTKYIHGTAKIDYAQFFDPFGLELEVTEGRGTFEKIGITRSESTAYGLYIEGVNPGTDAAKAGIGHGDLLMEINGGKATDFDADDFFETFEKGKELKIQLARASGVQDVKVKWSGNDGPKSYKLVEKSKQSKAEKAMLEDWLKSRQ